MVRNFAAPMIFLGSLGLLTACDAPMSDTAGAGVPGSAEANCIAAVEDRTGSSGASVVQSSISESGTATYSLEVSGSGAWTCIAGSNGLVDQVFGPPKIG